MDVTACVSVNNPNLGKRDELKFLILPELELDLNAKEQLGHVVGWCLQNFHK
jgi:hypothetical protein